LFAFATLSAAQHLEMLQEGTVDEERKGIKAMMARFWPLANFLDSRLGLDRVSVRCWTVPDGARCPLGQPWG